MPQLGAILYLVIISSLLRNRHFCHRSIDFFLKEYIPSTHCTPWRLMTKRCKNISLMDTIVM